MNPDGDKTDGEAYAATGEMTHPTSDIPCPKACDNHALYERRAQQYLQLSDGGKALANAVEAVKFRNDSYTAHWLAGKAYVSLAMYEHGIYALSTALDLCSVEDKRHEILIELLVCYCSRKTRSVIELGVKRKISGRTWATVAYELTKSRMFNEAYIAYSQLEKVVPCPSNIHVDLQPLCDVATVTTETWILDLVTCLLRHGSDHNTMTSQGGDTYIHVVVRMCLAAGALGLLEYVLGNLVRHEELNNLLDYLGNTALHMAAQCQKCSPLVRLDVMGLLVEAGVDKTAKNNEGKTAVSYLLRAEKNLHRCHQEYKSICSEMVAEKTMQAVKEMYSNVDIANSDDDHEEVQESTPDERAHVQEKQTMARTFNSTTSPQTPSINDDVADNSTKDDTTDLLLQKSIEVPQMVTESLDENCNRQAIDSHTISSRIQEELEQNDFGESLHTNPEEHSPQHHTTNNQGQSVPTLQEEEGSAREPFFSSQDIEEDSAGNCAIDGEVLRDYLPVESVLNTSKPIVFNVESVTMDVQNGLPEQQLTPTINTFSYDDCETKNTMDIQDDASQIRINGEEEHEIGQTSDVSDDDRGSNLSAGPPEYSDNDTTQTVGIAKDESCGSGMKLEVSLNEVTSQSSQNSVTHSHQLSKKSDNAKDGTAGVLIQCVDTDENRDGKQYTIFPHVQSLFNQDNAFEAMAPEDNDDISAKITSVHKNDDIGEKPSSCPPEDNDNPQTGRIAEDEAGSSEPEHDVSLNDVPSQSSQETLTQQHDVSRDGVTCEKFQCDDTGAILLETVISHDNSCRHTSDEHLQHDVIGQQTNGVCENQVIAQFDTQPGDSNDHSDGTSTADDNVSEKSNCTPHDQSKDGNHGQEDEKVLILRTNTDSHSRDSLNETVKGVAETKTIHKELKSLFKEGKSWLELNQYYKGVAVFGTLLNKAHLLSTDKYITKTTNLICKYLGDSDDSGHFEVCELLLKKFKEDPHVYCQCDPNAADRNGDGLLHLAIRQPDGSQSRKAIEFLILHIQSNSKNKKGQYASDFIREKHDPRWRLLEPIFSSIPTQQKRQKRKKMSRQSARDRKGMPSSDLQNAVNKTGISEADFLVTTQAIPPNEIDRNLTSGSDSDLSADDKNVRVNKIPVTTFLKSADKLAAHEMTKETKHFVGRNNTVSSTNEDSISDKSTLIQETIVSDGKDIPKSSIPIESDNMIDDEVDIVSTGLGRFSSLPYPQQSARIPTSQNHHTYSNDKQMFPTDIQECSSFSKTDKKSTTKTNLPHGKTSNSESTIPQGEEAPQVEREKEKKEEEEEEEGELVTTYAKENQPNTNGGTGRDDAATSSDKNNVPRDNSMEQEKSNQPISEDKTSNYHIVLLTSSNKTPAANSGIQNSEANDLSVIEEDDNEMKMEEEKCGGENEQRINKKEEEEMARMASEKQTVVVEDGGIMGEYDEKSREKRFNRTATKLSAQANPAHGEFPSSESELMHVKEEEDKDQKKNGRDRKKEDDEEDYKENVDDSYTSTKKKQTDSGCTREDEVDHMMNTDEPPGRPLNEFRDQISSKIEDLPWEVECTKSFVKTMSGNINSKKKKKILKTISKLANGNWHPSISKELHSPDKPENVWLYEAKIGKGCRLIWQKAIAFSSKLSVTTVEAKGGTHSNKDISGAVIYSEVIRIWDYVPNHDGIYKCVVNICSALKNEKQENMKRLAKPQSTLKKTLPAYFGHDLAEIGVMRPPVKVAKKEFQIVKFYAFSADMFEHIRKQSTLNVDFPFRVTDLEHSIINLESRAPILLIGRSGTGKTICCLYRLWHQFIGHLSIHCEQQELTTLEGDVANVYKDNNTGDCDQVSGMNKKVTNSCIDTSVKPEGDQQHMMDDSVLCHNRLHQIFVTRNKLLCSKAKRNFNDMKHGSSIVQKVGLCDDNLLPWRFDDIHDSQYPLFLTLEQLLILMDASVGPRFFYDRESNGSLKGSKMKLFEEDSSISGITERMREGVITVHKDSLKSRETCQQPTEVTYEIFSNDVWPKIKTGCKYQPLLVWTEFISIIKGSYEALLQPEGYLPRAMYHTVGKKKAPNFDGNREEIYSLFEKYQHFSKKKNHFDECDLIHSIQSRLQPQHTESWAIHQLFVDEIQDFTQAELCLLIEICQDPNQMFLTGDTAQTVMHGIEFRFCDLKSMFYNIRESMKTGSRPGKYLVEVPEKVHQLAYSYRSHDGILSLASSVLDIMAHLFPDSFDRLQPEKSLIEGGPLPVLFESSSFAELVMHIFDKNDETDDDSDIELGVHQAILVINETALQHLPRQLQQNITLTIYESKGLEFNNIFLFNFFKFSQASKEWRAVTSLLTELTANDTDVKTSRTGMYQLDEGMLSGKGRPRALEFDQKRHKVLNSELKLFYTAVTRARVNVWIFDEDEEKRRPMFEYFQARKLVTVKTKQSSRDFPGTWSEKDEDEYQSKRAEWRARGKEFMRTGVYREAAKCFDKGGDKQSATLAKAHNSRDIARNLPDQKSRKTKFLQTAELYRKCDSPYDAHAIPCYVKAGDFRAAATYCEEIKKFEQAAVLYKTLNKPVESSNCYEKAHCFDDAVNMLYESGNYEMAIDVVSRYDKQMKTMESKNENIPLQMKDHSPCKTYTRQQLRITCAEFYDREYQGDRNDVNINKMKHHLGYLSFDKHCEVLMRLGQIDLTVELMLTKGINSAVEMAKRSTNKHMMGECLIVAAQVMLRTEPENKLSDDEKQVQKEEVVQILQEAIDISLQTSNSQLQGEACFLKGELTNEVTDINESWSAFIKCDPMCVAGQLECMDWMVRNSDLHDFQNLSHVVKNMHNLFGVLNLLVSDKAGGDQIYKYYGLRPTSDGFLKMFPQQKSRALHIIKRCQNKAEHKKTECEVTRKLARDEICRFLLERGHYWYVEITLALNKLRNQREQCRDFILGLNCTKVADGGECSSRHDIMTENDLKSLLDVDLLHLEIDWHVQQGCGRLLKDIASDLADMVNVFLPDTTHDHMARFKSCEVLLHHLMPREHFPFRMTEKGQAQASRLQNYICHNRKERKWRERKHLKEQMVCYLKAKYNYMTQERNTNTDVFVKLYFLVNYLHLKDVDTKNLMKEFETEVRKEHLEKDQSTIKKRLEPLGFLVDTPLQTLSVQCVVRQFCEAYLQLTILVDPLEALVEFTTFIDILGHRNKIAILPEFSDFLMWTEYFTTVAVCFGAKNNQVTNVFFLPASYISLVYFIDSSFKTNGQPTFEIIQRHKRLRGKHLTLSQDRAERIIGVLCGSEIRMNLIRILFKLREDRAMDYGLAERLLVLCLTILCNMGKALFASKEADMMQQLCLIALPADCPPRLVKAVRAVQEAEGLADIAAALKELLHDRDQEHVCVCQWSSSDRDGIRSKVLDKLTLLSLKFCNPDTKKRMGNPGQDRVTTEEDEDAVAGSLAELETDMTMEEKVKWECEQKTYEENQKKENSALIITRFFKQIRFRLQCSILHCLVEEELQREQSEKRLKKFQQFGIDDRACTICDVIFDKPSSQTTNVEEWPKVSDPAVSLTRPIDETGDSQTSEGSAATWRAKKKQLHEESLAHHRNTTDFMQLKLTYKTQIAARQEEIVEFIRKHNLRTERGLKNYADMKLHLTRLVNQSDTAQNEFVRILAKRDWGNTSLLMQFFREAKGCFLIVKPYVEEQWSKLPELPWGTVQVVVASPALLTNTDIGTVTNYLLNEA